MSNLPTELLIPQELLTRRTADVIVYSAAITACERAAEWTQAVYLVSRMVQRLHGRILCWQLRMVPGYPVLRVVWACTLCPGGCAVPCWLEVVEFDGFGSFSL